jgi:cytochrome P450
LDDFKNLGPADKAAAEMRGYLSDLAEQRRDEPQDDLVSALVAVNDAQDGRLSDVELIANLVVLFVAGFETTTNLLGNGIHLGFEHPEILARVREGAITTAAFVEEVLRYDAPVQLTSRHAVADGAMVGQEPLAKGGRVFLLIGAANRDPRRFENPNVFDPTRPDNQSLSFGAGIH